MRPKLFDIGYVETYYFANIVNNILQDPFLYLRSLNDFFGEDNYKGFLEPFPKTSRLHHFIYFVIHSINYEEINDDEVEAIKRGKRKLWIEVISEHYDFQIDTFDFWLETNDKSKNEITEDEIMEYLHDIQLYGEYEHLLEWLSEEVFFILFLNRLALQRFNTLISHEVRYRSLDELDDEDLPYFRKNGVLKRVNVPSWVQRAVLHRDRGLCVSCGKDISGQVSIGSIPNFDHIIPLESGGINDITNIQLLCENCNKSKGSNIVVASQKYEKWY